MTAGDTVMWEAKAADGRVDDLLAVVLRLADPAAQVYRSADGRIVVIDPTGRGVPDAGTALPGDLLARPPHRWRFERVPREENRS